MEPVDDTEKPQAETDADIVARFDGLMTPIVAIHCFGSGIGRDHRRCFRSINLSPEEPGTVVPQRKPQTMLAGAVGANDNVMDNSSGCVLTVSKGVLYA